jgi:allene oxide cyclase
MGTRTISAALILGAGLLLAPTAASAKRRPARVTVVHVIEHADTDVTIDTGKAGDTSGDLLTFHNLLYDKKDRKVVGRDQGYCIRISPQDGSYECNWTAFLAGGQITVEGPFLDNAGSTLAITGGTGRYRRARGEMELRSREGGTKFDFIYRIAR